MALDLSNYVDVPTRLRLALEAFPDLRITELPPTLVVDGQFVSVTVTVHRTPDDPVPVTATAWEPFPGKTPYTRDSEMMNASTSALGRALGFMGFGLGASIATSDEVLNRVTDRVHSPSTSREAGTGSGRTYQEPDPAGPMPRPSSKAASDPQKRLIRRLLQEKDYTIEDGLDVDTLTMSDAMALIDLLKAQPEVVR